MSVDINKKLALLLRISTWDVLANAVGQEPTFDNHQCTQHQLIQQLQCTLPTNVHLFWKSATTIHVHQVQGDGWFHTAHIIYMTISQALNVYMYPKEIMENLQVLYLGIYNSTYLSGAH